MTDMNVNGLGNIQNANLSSAEKAEQKPEEIMLFGASTSESDFLISVRYYVVNLSKRILSIAISAFSLYWAFTSCIALPI